jgi:hypothetical protein
MATKKPAAAGAATKGIKVVCAAASYYRGGIQFSKEPKVVSLADLSEEQLAEIKGDPDLAVVEVDIAADDAK